MAVVWLPEIRRRILVGLRDEPLDYYRLAVGIGEAPFRVHAELKALRRDRLVHTRLAGCRIEWQLTDRGERIAHHEDQLSIGGV
jgi:predicted transcriptional regulator